jgi:hypothetical protein
LTDQSTIIFIFFADTTQFEAPFINEQADRQAARNSHARGEGTKVVVALHLSQDSILIASWRNQIRIHLSRSPIAGSGGKEACPISNFTCVDWSGSI